MTMVQPELFQGLSTEATDEALALGKRLILPSGAELFGLGATAENLYIIERGRIRLTLPLQIRGRQEDVLVEERAAGQTVGWSALIPPYLFTLKATAPLETEIIAIPRASLLAFFDSNPSAAYAVTLNLAAVIGQRLQLFQAMWLREIQRMVESRCA